MKKTLLLLILLCAIPMFGQKSKTLKYGENVIYSGAATKKIPSGFGVLVTSSTYIECCDVQCGIFNSSSINDGLVSGALLFGGNNESIQEMIDWYSRGGCNKETEPVPYSFSNYFKGSYKDSINENEITYTLIDGTLYVPSEDSDSKKVFMVSEKLKPIVMVRKFSDPSFLLSLQTEIKVRKTNVEKSLQ